MKVSVYRCLRIFSVVIWQRGRDEQTTDRALGLQDKTQNEICFF